MVQHQTMSPLLLGKEKLAQEVMLHRRLVHNIPEGSLTFSNGVEVRIRIPLTSSVSTQVEAKAKYTYKSRQSIRRELVAHL